MSVGLAREGHGGIDTLNQQGAYQLWLRAFLLVYFFFLEAVPERTAMFGNKMFINSSQFLFFPSPHPYPLKWFILCFVLKLCCVMCGAIKMSCVRTEGRRGHCSAMVGHLICRKNDSLHLREPLFSAFTEPNSTSCPFFWKFFLL